MAPPVAFNVIKSSHEWPVIHLLSRSLQFHLAAGDRFDPPPAIQRRIH
jgi:hypothetical protein